MKKSRNQVTLCNITLSEPYLNNIDMGWTVQDLNPTKEKGFSSPKNVQNSSTVHPDSYSTGTEPLLQE